MKNGCSERTRLLDTKSKYPSTPIKTYRQIDTCRPVPFFKLYRYSSTSEQVALILGAVCTIISGVAYSFFAINLGRATSVIVNFVQRTNHNVSSVDKNAADDDLYNGVMEFVGVNCTLALTIMICTFLGILIFNYTAISQTFRIRNHFLRSILNQDIGWHDVNQTGDLSSRITDDLKKVEEGIGEKVTMFIYYLTVFVASLIQALILGWELTLVCMLSLPVSAIAMSCVSYVSSKMSVRETAAYGAAGALAEEVFTSLKTVVGFGGEKVESERYNKLLTFACDNNIKRALFNGSAEGFTWFLVYANYSLGFWYGVNLIVRDRGVPPHEAIYDPGTAISIFFSVFSASWNFSMSIAFLETFGVAKGAASKIFSIIESKPIINVSKNNGQRFDQMQGKIVFKNVHFEYPSRPTVKVLKGLDLVINPGETVALVGSSGCGKSTCIQLLQRHYDPDLGDIYIDDHKLEDLDLAWYRNSVGVVGQEPILFDGTIAENIKLGSTTISMHDIEQAARKANAHTFIKKLPMEYDTLVGDRGTQLSGGQKQRLAIARALARKPSILLLDEATSALDTTSEAIVQAALETASTECTTITVAHRLSTVRKADRIVVISDGRIEEQGTHEELVSKKSAYYELITSQIPQDELHKEDILTSLKDEHVSRPVYSRCISSDSESRRKSTIFDTYIKEVFNEQKGFFTQIKEILKYNSPEGWAVTIGCLCATIIGLSMPVYSVLYGTVVGVLSIEDNNELLRHVSFYCLCFLIVGTIMFIANLFQTYLFGLAGERLTMRLRSMMFNSFLVQEMGYFDHKNHSVGSLCGLLAAEAASVQAATGERIGIILSSMATVITAVGVSFYFEWRLTLIAMCFAPIIVIIVLSEKKMVVKESQEHYQTLQKSTKIAVEAVNGIRTVASLGCEEIFHNSFMTEVLPYQNIALVNTHIRGLIYAISRSIMIFAYAATFYYGSVLIRDEGLHYSVMFIVTMAIVSSSWSLSKGFVFTPNLQKGLLAAGRIINVINRRPLISNGSMDPLERWKRTDVEYDNVYFSYPTRPKNKVLRGLNFLVLQGKTVALVGPSGCGKSTIVQLLERFYDPLYGDISVGDVPIDTMHLSALRSQLGIVSQEPNLFNRTIAENIAYGDNSRKVSDIEVVEAAKNANIHNFIISLPLGYDTKLGEKGTQLSGGQKQRIAIARALVRNPRILLLDEATSALDTESEKVVQIALDRARMGRTCITIAHRLSTIQNADIICVINRGKVAEMGNHHELLTLKGLYYELYSLQH